LYLTCKDIAQSNLKPIVNSADSVKTIIIEISKNRLGATMVKENDAIIGIITDGDIRRMIEHNNNLEGIKASDIMNKNYKSIQSTELAANAAVMMRELKISQLAVMEDTNYVGMIHIHDLNKEGLL